MDVFVRADASEAIGTGHVMRTLTLADRLRAEGASVAFGCRRLPGDAIDRVRARGFEVIDLGRGDPAERSWLGVPLETEIAVVRSALDGAARRPRLIVVDHYELDARWEDAVGGGAAVLAIDDLADRPHAAALLLDQNVATPGRYAALVPAQTRCFLGPEYALLRPAFVRARAGTVPRERVRRLLIFYGGVDGSGETLRALRALRSLAADLAVDVVAPPGLARREAVVRAAADDARMTVHGYVEEAEMASLMRTADLALGAAGTTSWERAFLGLPAVVTAIAANQGPVIGTLAAAGAAVDLGSAGAVHETAIATAVEALVHDGERLRTMSVRAAGLFVGYDAAQKTMYGEIFDRLR